MMCAIRTIQCLLAIFQENGSVASRSWLYLNEIDTLNVIISSVGMEYLLLDIIGLTINN